ncbi:MAG: zinc ribbon domain-containing protein [Myxococcales bacterium]|nr:zinc ribbon domain-containing protein [Myxococcales bacterium]
MSGEAEPENSQNPVLAGKPAPGGRCKVCGGTLSDSLRCEQCGAAYGEANRCPHCRSVADVEPAEPLRFRCRVCGGPRIPVDSREIVRTGREVPVLAKAKKAHFARAAWAVAAGVVGGFGVLSFLMTLLVVAFGPGLLTSLAMLGMSLLPFVVAALAWQRSKRHAKERDRLLDDAWSLVASDVLTHTGKELEADDLAKLMRIDVERAEQVLAHLSAEDFIHARVTDEGDIAYSSRLRVEPALEEPEEEAAPPEQDEAEELARARAPKP